MSAIGVFSSWDTLDNYIQSSEILTKQKEISVCMEDYPPIYVWADEFKTEEVFMNYFSNAINYALYEKCIDVKIRIVENKVRVIITEFELVQRQKLFHHSIHFNCFIHDHITVKFSALNIIADSFLQSLCITLNECNRRFQFMGYVG